MVLSLRCLTSSYLAKMLESFIFDGASGPRPIQKVTQKNKTIAKTFIGSEAIEAIKEYLDERRRGTEKLPAETITEKSPLFRTNEKGAVKRMSKEGLSNILEFHCRKLGEKKLSAHSFRKYFQTQLESVGAHPNWIDQMIGQFQCHSPQFHRYTIASTVGQVVI